jgi:hypothetical protein
VAPVSDKKGESDFTQMMLFLAAPQQWSRITRPKKELKNLFFEVPGFFFNTITTNLNCCWSQTGATGGDQLILWQEHQLILAVQETRRRGTVVKILSWMLKKQKFYLIFLFK